MSKKVRSFTLIYGKQWVGSGDNNIQNTHKNQKKGKTSKIEKEHNLTIILTSVENNGFGETSARVQKHRGKDQEKSENRDKH